MSLYRITKICFRKKVWLSFLWRNLLLSFQRKLVIFNVVSFSSAIDWMRYLLLVLSSFNLLFFDNCLPLLVTICLDSWFRGRLNCIFLKMWLRCDDCGWCFDLDPIMPFSYYVQALSLWRLNSAFLFRSSCSKDKCKVELKIVTKINYYVKIVTKPNYYKLTGGSILGGLKTHGTH